MRRAADRQRGMKRFRAVDAGSAVSFAAGIASIYFIFMRLVDRVNQKMLFGAGALLQVIGMLLLSGPSKLTGTLSLCDDFE